MSFINKFKSLFTELAGQNPLLKDSPHPHGAPSFDRVRVWHYEPAVKKAIVEAKADIDRIKNNPDAPTFENTIEALEFSGKKLSRVLSLFSNACSVSSSDDMRAIEKPIKLAAAKHGNDVSLDGDLFARIKTVYDGRDKMNLGPEQKMLLEETYKGFVRSGALLDAAGKKRLREISERMTEVKTNYSNNVLQSTNAYEKWIDDETLLDGVPERSRALYADMAKEAGGKAKYLVKLSPPPMDILTHATNRGLREEIQKAMGNVAYKGKFDNSENVKEIARLRLEAANLLGFDSHAAFVLDDRMAKTPDAVMSFLQKNGARYRPAAEEYLQKLKDYARDKDGIGDLKPWDIPYYGRRLKEETFSIDAEEIRRHFNLERVLEGLRQHAEKLFNIKMTESTAYPKYHKDVRVYEVTDKTSGEMVGLFYADYYARGGEKRGGAWMTTFRDRGIEDGVNKFPFVTNVCNFDKPTKDRPTLLSIDEVRTVFHEFGHGLHALMARGDYTSLTGTSVKWDFVELPSQLQENWVQEKEVLDTFARHYKTDEPLPAETIEKLKALDNFDAGYFGLRQTFLGLLDMKWHTITDASQIPDAEKLEDDLIAESWLFPRAAGPMSMSFSHIFAGGYSAGYYSYKWAEVLDADIFEEFKTKGLYDRATADRVRNTIYAEGGTRDPMEIYLSAKGRAPDPEAMFRREGLTPKNDNADRKPAGQKPPAA